MSRDHRTVDISPKSHNLFMEEFCCLFTILLNKLKWAGLISLQQKFHYLYWLIPFEWDESFAHTYARTHMQSSDQLNFNQPGVVAGSNVVRYFQKDRLADSYVKCMPVKIGLLFPAFSLFFCTSVHHLWRAPINHRDSCGWKHDWFFNALSFSCSLRTTFVVEWLLPKLSCTFSLFSVGLAVHAGSNTLQKC